MMNPGDVDMVRNIAACIFCMIMTHDPSPGTNSQVDSGRLWKLPRTRFCTVCLIKIVFINNVSWVTEPHLSRVTRTAPIHRLFNKKMDIAQ